MTKKLISSCTHDTLIWPEYNVNTPIRTKTSLNIFFISHFQRFVWIPDTFRLTFLESAVSWVCECFRGHTDLKSRWSALQRPKSLWRTLLTVKTAAFSVCRQTFAGARERIRWRFTKGKFSTPLTAAILASHTTQIQSLEGFITNTHFGFFQPPSAKKSHLSCLPFMSHSF